MSHEIDAQFILLAVQDWGHPESKGIAATQAVLDAAGFIATATCRPVFGAIWPKPYVGPDAMAATEWLKSYNRDDAAREMLRLRSRDVEAR